MGRLLVGMQIVPWLLLLIARDDLLILNLFYRYFLAELLLGGSLNLLVLLEVVLRAVDRVLVVGRRVHRL